MQFPIAIESDSDRPVIATWLLLFAHAAAYVALRGLSPGDLFDLSVRPRSVTPLNLLTAQFVVVDARLLIHTLILLGLFATYVEQRLGGVRMLVLYLGLGALTLAVGAWTQPDRAPLAGPLGLLCFCGLVLLTAPLARIDVVTWIPAYGIWKPKLLRWPVWLWVGALVIAAWVFAPFLGARVMLLPTAVSIGLLAAFALRSRPLRDTGWSLPPEPRGGEIADHHQLEDATAVWRLLDEHLRAAAASTEADPPAAAPPEDAPQDAPEHP